MDTAAQCHLVSEARNTLTQRLIYYSHGDIETAKTLLNERGSEALKEKTDNGLTVLHLGEAEKI